ncbi:dicarboxylate/amino acid:cation symporter [Streptomyces sp. NP160]|uniref:dicarboxylate/amino acid:cation symporter n=1 Tax=Streptomyces sp. NP160 TaxID=2586637 RepID=UPI00111A345E|nr:dicarboxylate/amino acid:cation symporter [Streptomyces sp. NP160]TNM67883.1 dicarboxylate/amino acid:cation symporter [Streptomyces sp. NP160]
MSSTPGAPARPRPSSPLSRLGRVPFGAQVIAGLVLGVVLGLVAREMGPVVDGAPDNWLVTALDTTGSTFVTLLVALVPPLVLLAVITSIANLRQVAGAARLAGQTLLWFAVTAAVSVAIGLTIGVLTDPGTRSSVDESAAGEPSRTGSWLDFLQGVVPSNWLGLGASTSTTTTGTGADLDVSSTTSLSFNVLQLIVIAIAVGVAALRTGDRAEPFLAFARSALAVVQTVLWWVIRLAPLGTVGLLGRAVATYGWEALSPLGVFVVDVYVGLALVLFVLYPVLLRAHGLGVRRFFAGAWPAISLAFVSRSSVGTMPVTERVTERNLGVPRAYTSFAVPLGATTKMDGCAAIYPAIAAIFVAGFFGVDLSWTDYLLIAFVSVVGSAATAGLTGATVMLTLTLSTLGLPLAGVGLLLAIDPILDMGRTAVNVAGQALVPTIVAKREGILDRDRYDGRTLPAFLSEGEERAAGARAAEGQDDALVGAGSNGSPAARA